MTDMPAWQFHMRRALVYGINAIGTYIAAFVCLAYEQHVGAVLLAVVGIGWLSASRTERMRAWRSL